VRAVPEPEGPAPYEFICELWTSEPKRFRLDPIHESPGLNNLRKAFFERAEYVAACRIPLDASRSVMRGTIDGFVAAS
jgi:hypothetical protein